MHRVATMILLLAAPLLSGCYKPPRSYVDFTVPQVGYEDIQRLPQPIRVVVEVEFQRNGQRLPSVEPEIRGMALQILRGTGVFVPDDRAIDRRVRIVMNNIADTGAARGQFLMREFVPGAGLLNADLVDRYEFSLELATPAATRREAGITHAIYLVLGIQDPPAGAQPVSLPVAVNRVLENMLLRAVRTMQQNGDLDIMKVSTAT